MNRNRNLYVFLFYRTPIVYLHLDTMIASLMEYSVAVSFYSASQINEYPTRRCRVSISLARLTILIQNGLHISKQQLEYHVKSGSSKEYIQTLLAPRSYPKPFLKVLVLTAVSKSHTGTLSALLSKLGKGNPEVDSLHESITKGTFWQNGKKLVRSVPYLEYALLLAVHTNNIPVIQYIIRKGKIHPDTYGGRALLIAISCEHTRCVSTLLDLGAAPVKSAFVAAEFADDKRIYKLLQRAKMCILEQ